MSRSEDSIIFYMQRNFRNGHEVSFRIFFFGLFETGSQVFPDCSPIYDVVEDDIEVVILLLLCLSSLQSWG